MPLRTSRPAIPVRPRAGRDGGFSRCGAEIRDCPHSAGLEGLLAGRTAAKLAQQFARSLEHVAHGTAYVQYRFNRRRRLGCPFASGGIALTRQIKGQRRLGQRVEAEVNGWHFFCGGRHSRWLGFCRGWNVCEAGKNRVGRCGKRRLRRWRDLAGWRRRSRRRFSFPSPQPAVQRPWQLASSRRSWLPAKVQATRRRSASSSRRNRVLGPGSACRTRGTAQLARSPSTRPVTGGAGGSKTDKAWQKMGA